MAPRELSVDLALVARIGRLAGVEVVESGGDTLPRQVTAYLQEQPSRRTIGNPRTVLFCRMNSDGIAVHGLDNWARHQVVMRGWGKLLSNRALLFLPRDDTELETCWSILQQAYESLTDPSANALGRCNAPNREMPKYSRTTLQ